MKRILPILLIWAAAAMAQAPEGSANAEKLKAAHFLAGDWRGSGWYISQGKKLKFDQTENIQLKLDGTAMLIEGLGVIQGSEDYNPRNVHASLAVLVWNVDDEKYHMHAFRNDGGYADAIAEFPGKNKMTWGFKYPGTGEIRYTITIDEDGNWVETGEMSSDGKQWNTQLEMTLKKE